MIFTDYHFRSSCRMKISFWQYNSPLPLKRCLSFELTHLKSTQDLFLNPTIMFGALLLLGWSTQSFGVETAEIRTASFVSYMIKADSLVGTENISYVKYAVTFFITFSAFQLFKKEEPA